LERRLCVGSCSRLLTATRQTSWPGSWSQPGDDPLDAQPRVIYNDGPGEPIVSPNELRELAQQVLPLVHEAGGIAHSYFCSQALNIDAKADGSPVTQADRETRNACDADSRRWGTPSASSGRSSARRGPIGSSCGSSTRLTERVPLRADCRTGPCCWRCCSATSR